MPLQPRAPEKPLLDLPELDKSEDADEVDVGSFELDLSGDDDLNDGDDALDAFEVDISMLSDDGSSEAAADLDIGMHDLLDALPEVPAAVERDSLPPAVGGDLDWQLDAPLETDEPSTDAELGDDGLETLPELAADENELDSGPDMERSELAAAPEGAIARGPSFEAEWLLLGSACQALSVEPDEVLACGEHLMRFGSQRESLELPPGINATSAARLQGGGVMLATARGLLELSTQGSWSFPSPPELLRGTGSSVVELIGTAGTHELWARLSNGALLRRRGGLWERHEAGGAVRSLARHEQQVTLLVIARRPTLQYSHDAGSSFRELLLPEPAAKVALGAAPTALRADRVLVIADAERGLCVSADAGEHFRMVTGAVNVTAVTVGAHQGRPMLFAALYREGRDVSELVMIDPESAQALSVAELSGDADEDAEETGRTYALICADGHLWAAGGYGLAKLRPR